MRMLLVATSLAAALASARAIACEDDERPVVQIGLTSVARLQQLWKARAVVILDASGQAGRTALGVIPGARLLTSSSDFDVTKELPAEKTASLVFYCEDARCSSSDQAAERAIAAGYAHVSVLREGVSGWRAAGHPVQAPRPAARTASPKPGRDTPTKRPGS